MRAAACWLLLSLLSFGCEKSDPPPAEATATATVAAAPVFDVEGFCEKAMGVGRSCEGDDELMEGNKIGLCSTTLRAARDDEGIVLDADAGAKCLADARAADPPLPDVRTLTTLAQRFETCRRFTEKVPSLSKVAPVKVGAAEEGEACEVQSDCVHGHFCDDAKCAPQKKAGDTCKSGQECVGRCSRKDGMKCVPYCGAG